MKLPLPPPSTIISKDTLFSRPHIPNHIPFPSPSPRFGNPKPNALILPRTPRPSKTLPLATTRFCLHINPNFLSFNTNAKLLSHITQPPKSIMDFESILNASSLMSIPLDLGI